MIRQHTTKRHNSSHQKMRKGSNQSSLFNLETELVFQEGALIQNKEIEVPRTTEIRNYDGVDRHGCHHLLPWSSGYWWHCSLLRTFSQGLFNVLQLLYADCWMFSWIFKTEPQPETVPEGFELEIIFISWKTISGSMCITKLFQKYHTHKRELDIQ